MTDIKILQASLNRAWKKKLEKKHKKKRRNRLWGLRNDSLGHIDLLEDNEWVDINDISRIPSENDYYLVQWEHNDLKNIEWAVYEDNKWIAMRDSLNITPKVVAWKKVEPYVRNDEE